MTSGIGSFRLKEELEVSPTSYNLLLNSPKSYLLYG